MSLERKIDSIIEKIDAVKEEVAQTRIAIAVVVAKQDLQQKTIDEHSSEIKEAQKWRWLHPTIATFISGISHGIMSLTGH